VYRGDDRHHLLLTPKNKIDEGLLMTRVPASMSLAPAVRVWFGEIYEPYIGPQSWSDVMLYLRLPARI
jgi:hypothetical protein